MEGASWLANLNKDSNVETLFDPYSGQGHSRQGQATVPRRPPDLWRSRTGPSSISWPAAFSMS